MQKIMLSLIAALYASLVFSQDLMKAAPSFQRSYVFESSGDYVSAIKEFDNIPNKFYEVYLRLGWLNYLNKNYPNSIKQYRAAIASSTNSIEARLGLINPLSASGNYEEMLKVYSEILKIDVNHSKANYWIAVTYYYRKDYAKSTEHLSRILNQYPFDYDANLLMAQVMLARGKIVEAKSHYTKAYLYNPTNKEIEAMIEKL